MTTTFNQSGSKYLRNILQYLVNGCCDVYAVLLAFDVRCPARQHAIKKLLCSGLRDKGSVLQDLREARDAVDRAIQFAEMRGNMTDAEYAEKIVASLPDNDTCSVLDVDEDTVLGCFKDYFVASREVDEQLEETAKRAPAK
jgi:hypothetical protein